MKLFKADHSSGYVQSNLTSGTLYSSVFMAHYSDLEYSRSFHADDLGELRRASRHGGLQNDMLVT